MSISNIKYDVVANEKKLKKFMCGAVSGESEKDKRESAKDFLADEH